MATHDPTDNEPSEMPGARPFLELRDVAKRFGATRVLEGLSLAVGEGEIVALLGLSGSGKTTALRILAGFEHADQGSVVLDGDDLARVPPSRRGIGMVFQHYALFPHMTVAQNVSFGLESQGWPKAKIAERVTEMLALVALPEMASRKIGEISGGQQQRVALARALAPEPRLLLLDEPLSNLDPELRERTRRELRAAVKRIGITTVLVTHEQEEAFSVGDRVAVMHDGRLEQVGTPVEIYRRPATRFVASFVGRSSALRGTVRSVGAGDGEGDRVRVLLSGSCETDHCVEWIGRKRDDLALAEGDAVDLVVRPESLRALTDGTERHRAVAGEVIDLRFTGPLTYALVELDGGLGRIECRVENQRVDDDACVGRCLVGDRLVVVPEHDGADHDDGLASSVPLPTVFPAGSRNGRDDAA